VDGNYGDSTAKAVKKFQEKNNLNGKDGAAGSETIIALLTQLGKASDKEASISATATASAKKAPTTKKAPVE